MTLLYLVPGSSLANGFGLWESFAKDTWSEFEGGAQKAGRGPAVTWKCLITVWKLVRNLLRPRGNWGKVPGDRNTGIS